jgi:hypothetical protein
VNQDGVVTFGELLRFYSTTSDAPVVLYVKLYATEEHISGMFRVDCTNERRQYIRPAEVGQAIVFAPWFDKGSLCAPNKQYYYATETVPKYKWQL